MNSITLASRQKCALVNSPRTAGSCSRRSVLVRAEMQMKPPSTMGSRPPPPNYSVSVFDALKFNGPAPELVNGRLAMVGLTYSCYKESLTGEMLGAQLEHVSVGTCLLLVLLVYASLVPILKGVKSEAFGPFSPRAEIVNGRTAMVAFAVLSALEAKAGVPFF